MRAPKIVRDFEESLTDDQRELAYKAISDETARIAWNKLCDEKNMPACKQIENI